MSPLPRAWCRLPNGPLFSTLPGSARTVYAALQARGRPRCASCRLSRARMPPARPSWASQPKPCTAMCSTFWPETTSPTGRSCRRPASPSCRRPTRGHGPSSADVVLPAQVWTEKSGHIVNVEGRELPVVPFIEAPKGIPADDVALGMLTIQMGKPQAAETCARGRVTAASCRRHRAGRENGQGEQTMSTKIKVASDWLAGCAGCHMSLLDIDERIVDTAREGRPHVDADHRPEAPVARGRGRRHPRGRGQQLDDRGGGQADARALQDPDRPGRLRRLRRRRHHAQLRAASRRRCSAPTSRPRAPWMARSRSTRTWP